MREIKFRAWDKETGMMSKNYAHMGKNGRLYVSWEGHDSDLVLMQYTGLKDKNGIEIYEGDIVHILESGNYGGEYNAEIEYLTEWATYGIVCMKVKEIAKSKTNPNVDTLFTLGFLTRHFGSCIQLGDAIEFDKCEVIGNIYENPELLEKGMK